MPHESTPFETPLPHPCALRAAVPPEDGPDRFGRDDLRLMGSVLRNQRTAAGMTLRRLSERSGIGVAAIRALESGQSNPSLATVVAVVEALGTTIDRALTAVRAARGRVVVTRAGPAPQAALSDGLVEAALDAHTLALPVKSLAPAPSAAARHATLCLVVQGALVVTTATGERVRLDEGDSYHAEPGTVQGWANAGARPVRLLSVADTRTTPDQQEKEGNA
jgi:transcriptional regulator with XRE-family HTH domain